MSIPVTSQRRTKTRSAWSYSPIVDHFQCWLNMPNRMCIRQLWEFRIFTGRLIGSWVITGEHRPYDRKVGYARRIIPERRWGAWEVVARYSQVDLKDRTVNGGILHKGLLAVNWWASTQWRISFGYGLADLNRKNLSGTTNIFQTRFQWIF